MLISDWSSDVCSSDLIPTLIKDMLPEKGIPASFGSAALKGFIPPDDAPYARAISNAGPISIARSSMPELGLNAVTESPLLGPTRNPWNLDYKPGGSSGGGSAAVAAGVVRSEQHTSELQSLMRISYAVFCLTKKTN